MTPAIVFATVVAGGAAAAIRYLVSLAFASRSRGGTGGSDAATRDFSWAVLIVNAAGSAVGGTVLGLAANGRVDAGIQLVLLAGLCGGLTTFSTLGVETVQLVTAGRWRVAAVSILANLVVGIGAAVGSYAVAKYVVGA